MQNFGRYISVNQEKQQYINRSLVINLLRQEGLCSRADLAKLTGLKRTTITNIINEFMECGLVIEDGLLNGAKGRRSIGIRINGNRYRVMGAMITRQDYSIGMMGLSGEVYHARTYTVEKGLAVEELLSKVSLHIKQTLEEERNSQVLALGITVPGPYKREGDKMVFATNLSGWDNLEISKYLGKNFDIPVIIENDANAGVWAQHWFRKTKTSRNHMVYVVAGQGIGCGMILNGELQRGGIGIAGELGHTSIDYRGPKCGCGNRGCLEKYCSSISVMNRVRERLAKGEPSCLEPDAAFSDFADAVRRGDRLANEEYRRACEFLAIGIVNLINQINPGNVIIGDLLTEVEPALFLDLVRNRVKESVRPLVWENLTIELNSLEYNPILVGAGVIAAQKVFENPISYLKKA